MAYMLKSPSKEGDFYLEQLFINRGITIILYDQMNSRQVFRQVYTLL